MLVLPGPGLLVIVIGFAILGTEYAWAAAALERTKRVATQAGTMAKSGAGRARAGRDRWRAIGRPARHSPLSAPYGCRAQERDQPRLLIRVARYGDARAVVATAAQERVRRFHGHDPVVHLVGVERVVETRWRARGPRCE